MKPVATHDTNATFELRGGTRENDLPLERVVIEGAPALRSTWAMTDEERQAIADGANVYLIVWGTGTPPVAVGVVGVEPA